MDEEKKDFRTHELWVRVRKGLYGKVWYGSQDTGLSMSKLSELCIEKSIDMVINQVKQEQTRNAKEKYGDK